MAKLVCINPVFAGLRGNYDAIDEHGHEMTFRFRETSWGTKYFGMGKGKKRDYVTNPLSPLEIASRQSFSDAVELRKKILTTSSLHQTWLAKFKDAKSKGETSCNTLNGYLMQTAINGGIDEDGNAI